MSIDELKIGLRQAHADNTFSSPSFYRYWFREKGSSYVFLFKKNIKVTNIQHAELMALILANIYVDVHLKERANNIQVFTTDGFKESVDLILQAIAPDAPTIDSICRNVADLYGDYLTRAIVLDAFYGSSVLHLPPELKIDLQRICALSGYIHSCGPAVYIRKVDKANKENFFDAVKDRYLPNIASGKRGRFIVYAHEDFTDYDVLMRKQLQNGLDDVKIYVEKYFMGEVRLAAVIHEMRQHFSETLFIPEPGDFRKTHDVALLNEEVDIDRTLWLIVDRAVNHSDLREGKERYYLAYEQLWFNQNPYHFFDEDKPAWVEHTTTPHTLIGAMVNITIPHIRSSSEEIKLIDPFCGTGTTLLEATKYKGLINISATGLDTDPLSPLLYKDNLWFFSVDADELEKIRHRIVELVNQMNIFEYENESRIKTRHQALSKRLTIPDSEDLGSDKSKQLTIQGFDSGSATLSAYETALNRFESLVFQNESAKSLRQKLEVDERIVRIFFYIALRTYRRHAGAFERGSSTWSTAFSVEAIKLNEEIGQLLGLRKDEVGNNANASGLIFSRGKYSQQISWKLAAVIGEESVPLKLEDALSLEQDCYDLIITDPPYGFNLEKGSLQLADLYSKFISCAVSALRPHGQLVLCLPDATFIGRSTVYFTHKEFVISQVIRAAESHGRHLIPPYLATPSRALYQPPYFWESERALRRAILHFRVI